MIFVFASVFLMINLLNVTLGAPIKYLRITVCLRKLKLILFVTKLLDKIIMLLL